MHMTITKPHHASLPNHVIAAPTRIGTTTSTTPTRPIKKTNLRQTATLVSKGGSKGLVSGRVENNLHMLRRMTYSKVLSCASSALACAALLPLVHWIRMRLEKKLGEQ